MAGVQWRLQVLQATDRDLEGMTWTGTTNPTPVFWYIQGGLLWGRMMPFREQCGTGMAEAYIVFQESHWDTGCPAPHGMKNRPSTEMGMLVRLELEPADRRRWVTFRRLAESHFDRLDDLLYQVIEVHVVNSQPWGWADNWDTRLVSIEDMPDYHADMERALTRLQREITTIVGILDALPTLPRSQRRPRDLYRECYARYILAPLPEYLRPICHKEHMPCG